MAADTLVDPAGALSLQREKMDVAAIGLREADTLKPGWRRIRCGKGWRFVGKDGASLGNAQRQRCESLVIPPAWQSVWINPDSKGHIQAYGTDAAGRRQYIYHPEWGEAAGAAKFADMLRFADKLPALRTRLKSTIANSDDEFERAVAVVVRLLDVSGLRIGHRRYRESSGAIGATTLQARHLKFKDGVLELAFPSKSGKFQTKQIDDPDLCAQLHDFCGRPGEDLFDLEDGRITAADVNAFIRAAMKAPFTAKDFRTWGGSVAAGDALRRAPEKRAKAVVEAAAEWLGNTPAVARQSYIHPAILRAAETDAPLVLPEGPVRLRAAERTCYGLILRDAEN